MEDAMFVDCFQSLNSHTFKSFALKLAGTSISSLITFLRSPTRLFPSIWTGKAFAVVFPLTRHSKVIDMFSAYIVFFAKYYWCKLAYVRTRVYLRKKY